MVVSIAIFAASMLSLVGVQPPSTPSIDRSAEPELRRVLKALGSLQSFELTISKSLRWEKTEPLTFESTAEVSFVRGPMQFRIVASGYWGESYRAVSDGKTLLIDTTQGDQPVVLRAAPKTIPQADRQLAKGGSESNPIFEMLEGSGSLETLLAPDSPIKRVKGEGALDAIEFRSKAYGWVTVFYPSGSELPLPRVIEYFNSESILQYFVDEPESVTSQFDGKTRLELSFRNINRALPASTFDTSPPAGAPVDDQRKSKGGGGFDR